APGTTEVRWDTDGDGEADDAVTSSPTLTLPPHTLTPGSYAFRLRVTDQQGLVSDSSTTMSVVGEASRISVLSGDVDGDGISDISIQIVGSEQNDVRLELASSPGGGMPIVRVYDGDTLVSEQSGRPVGGKIYVLGGTGNDAFTVRATFSDMSTADVTQIIYDGGEGFDTLSLSLNYTKITYDYRNPSDGKISVQDSSLTEIVSIDYTGLEPIVNTGTGADAEFILTGNADDATLTDIGGGTYRLSGASFEDTDFALPTGSLTIRGGGDGDSLTIASAISVPSITLDFETINLAANVTATTALAGGATTTTTVNVQNNTAQIADAITLVAAGGTVNVAAGVYNEDVAVNKSISLLGAGAALTTVIGPIGGTSSTTISIDAPGVEVAGFTITRAGNNTTDWNNPALNSSGIAIQGAGDDGSLVHDNIITGMRTGIDVNNSSTHTIRNNRIVDNRTGLIFRNQTDNLTVVENVIANNWTVGVLFLDASAGTNSPLQQAASSTFSNNNISGNWYGQIVDRQTGGSLPAAGANPKNFVGNWFGTPSPSTTIANSAESGYAALIPVAFGGAATPPGGQPEIAGPASANFVINPVLQTGLDTDVETTPGRGIFGFQGYTPLPQVWVDNDWVVIVDIGPAGLSQGDTVASDADDGDAIVAGKFFGYDAYSSLTDSLAAVAANGTIHVLAGSFTGALNINKNVTIDGQSDSLSLINAGGASTGIFVGSGNNVAIDDVALSGIGAAGVGVHVQGNLDLTDSTVTGGQTVVFVDGGDLDMLRTRAQAAPTFSIYGVSVAGGGVADIVDSEITGNGVSTAAAVAVSGSLSQASSVSITGSVLASGFYGLLNNPYGVSEVHESDLSGNMLLGVANADPNAVVDASNNWWGTTNEILVLAETLGRVDITPFLNAGDTNLLARGFQADTSLLNVTTLGEQSGATGRIQEGVDLVDVGGTVSVRDGVYDETVLVNKTATLQSTNLHGAQIKPTTGLQQTVVRVDAANVTIDGFAIQ
ncbi:MAG: right-handed parallel beta-helix repeat-containing protein, partial [Pirellulales bacterium]|nr:right-handed parallel beta-helix repeat-containing protein [Pirellulales bacterium]